MVVAGRLNDKLAREVLAGLLAGEGTPEQVVASRGLEVVSDDGVLVAAVDDVIAANPDVAQKIRDGKVAAAGAPHRTGDEGHWRQGRRRARARAHPGAPGRLADLAVGSSGSHL